MTGVPPWERRLGLVAERKNSLNEECTMCTNRGVDCEGVWIISSLHPNRRMNITICDPCMHGLLHIVENEV